MAKKQLELGMTLADKVFWFVVIMISVWFIWLKFVKPFGDFYEWFVVVVGPPIAYLIVKFIERKAK